MNESLRDYIGRLQARGELTFTKDKALKELGVSETAFLNSSLRLIKKGQLIKPFSGFYVIVSPEFRSVGGPPPIWYISALMKFLKQSYYVGLLSAGALHGASHQAVMELQVITNKPLKLLRIGKHRVRFIVNKYTDRIPTVDVKTPQGMVPISTAGATAVDMVRFHKRAGGFSHIATVLMEIGKKIETSDIVKVAEVYRDAPLIQRAGYLLEKYVEGIHLTTLHGWLKSQRCSYKRLSGKRTGPEPEVSKQWFLIIDVDVEPDDL